MKNVILMFKEKDQIFYREISKKGIEYMSDPNGEGNKCWKKQVMLKNHNKLEVLLNKDLITTKNNKKDKKSEVKTTETKKKRGRKPKQAASNINKVKKVKKNKK